MPTEAPVLVMAVGNTLLRDDGVGAAILEPLRELHGVDERVEFVDGGTQGLALLSILAARSALLLLDAVALGADPGTVHALPPNDAHGHAGTAHEMNAGELLAAAELLGDRPARSMLVGIEPDEIRTGLGLSPVVARSVPRAVATAQRELARLLVDIEAIPAQEASHA